MPHAKQNIVDFVAEHTALHSLWHPRGLLAKDLAIKVCPLSCSLLSKSAFFYIPLTPASDITQEMRPKPPRRNKQKVQDRVEPSGSPIDSKENE